MDKDNNNNNNNKSSITTSITTIREKDFPVIYTLGDVTSGCSRYGSTYRSATISRGGKGIIKVHNDLGSLSQFQKVWKGCAKSIHFGPLEPFPTWGMYVDGELVYKQEHIFTAKFHTNNVTKLTLDENSCRDY